MKDNILRGKILDLLRRVYPDGIDYNTILSALFAYHKADDITASLEYLTDKEYIEKKEKPHLLIKQEVFKWYKLRPKGIDLIEGNIAVDPGILIQRG